MPSDAVPGTGRGERRSVPGLSVGAELRAYREILRRRRLLILTATVVAAAVAGSVSTLMTPVYEARAEILLRPNDPSEDLFGDTPNRPAVDADRYGATQIEVVESKAVAQAVATEVDGHPDRILGQVSASQPPDKDVLVVAARDPEPERAADLANAFARAYIENRREVAMAALDRAAAELEARLAELASLTVPPEGFSPGPAQEAAAEQYQALSALRQQLIVERSLKRGEAELIFEADAPNSPSSPRPARNAALGGLAGLLAGLGYAFLREQLDDRLHARDEFEGAARLPVLTELPRHREASKHPTVLAVHAHPAGPFAEATRKLRTAMGFLAVEAPLRRIAVTSASLEEGKSFVAANLAAVYAQAGLRTILVSADLRRPGIDRFFPEAAGGPGLSGVVAGLVPDAPAAAGDAGFAAPASLGVRPTRLDGLSFLPAGELPPNPAELLGSARAAQVFEALSEMADAVVVDTPPALVTDAAVIASNMDGVIIVAVPGSTTRESLAGAVMTLPHGRTRLLGLVLNKVRTSDTAYYNLYDDRRRRSSGRYRHRATRKTGRGPRAHQRSSSS